MTPDEAAIAITLAKRAALRQIKQQRKRAGLRETLPMSVLSQLATQWLATHPELYAAAAADPLVQELARGRR
jgi:hypothetical protein